jgi:Protein of unknown function (DUF664)
VERPEPPTVAAERPISLRWIYCHMVEETARHNGHLDAMRELIDGVIGVISAPAGASPVMRAGGRRLA